MNATQQFQSLGCVVFAMAGWIKLRQWARRNGDKVAEARAEYWIADCKARAQRINQPSLVAMKEAA